MSIFQKLIDGLRQDRHPYEPVLMDFPPVDIEKLRNELRLEERGRERGDNDLPEKDQNSFDDIESELVTQFQNYQQRAKESLTKNLEAYAGRLARLDDRQLVGSIEHLTDDAISDFKLGVHNDMNRLFIEKANVIEINNEYKNFRAENKLNRLASYPINKWNNYVVAGFFALAETFANAYFFSRTHPGGWLGAVNESIIISIINAVVGIFAGYTVFRGLLSRNKLRSVFSFIIIILYLLFVIAFNFFAAHYRDAFANLSFEQLAASGSIASNTAWLWLQEKTVNLAGFQSYLMVIVGFIVAGVSAFKGFGLDDPFPGFGEVARRREKTLNAYTSEKEELTEALKERKVEAIDACDLLIAEIGRRDVEYAQVVEQRRNLIGQYNSALDQYDSAANHLLEVYRTANRQSRSTKPPVHFSRPWNPNWSREKIPDTNVGAHKRRSDEVVKKLGLFRKQLIGEFDKAVTRYLRIDQIVSEEELKDASTEVSEEDDKE